MLRRPLFSLLSISAMFVVTWQLVPAQQPKGGAQQGVPQHVQDQLDALKKQKEEKKWTFEVGHSKAAESSISSLAGTVVPPKIAQDLPNVSAHVNSRGSEWLKAD